MKQFMMRSVKTFLAIALLFTFSSSFAQSAEETPQPASFKTQFYSGSKPTRFIVVTENPKAEKVRIEIVGSSGKVYQVITRKKRMRTIFDFSQMEDDLYTLNVSAGGNKISKDVVVSTTYAAATKQIEIK